MSNRFLHRHHRFEIRLNLVHRLRIPGFIRFRIDDLSGVHRFSNRPIRVSGNSDIQPHVLRLIVKLAPREVAGGSCCGSRARLRNNQPH